MIATGGRADVRIHFEQFTDLRRGEPTYPLLNVVAMTWAEVISGSDDIVARAMVLKEQDMADTLSGSQCRDSVARSI